MVADDTTPELIALASSRVAPETVEQEPPTDAEMLMEVGVDQNLPFTQPYTGNNKKFNDAVEISRAFGIEPGPTVAQLQSMRRQDGQSRALYRLLTLPLRSALKGCKFKPADDGEEEAEFIDAMLTLPPNAGGMSTPFERVMAQILMGVFDGFAAFEQVYDYGRVGVLEGKYVLRKLAHRPSETITFLADKHGGFQGLRQKAVFSGEQIDKAIPARECFYWAAQEEERKFYGVSYFEAAYYSFDAKVQLYYIAHLGAQRAAVGTRVGQYPRSATKADRQAFGRQLGNLSVAQFMTMPDDYNVNIMKEGGTFDFLSLINYHNSQMSKSVLAPWFDKAQGGGGGDASLVNFASQDDAMFILMLRTIMDEIAAAINTYIIPKFIDWNFGSGKYPTFEWGTLTDEQRKAVARIFEKIMSAPDSGVSREFILELEKKMAEELDIAVDYEQMAQDDIDAMVIEAADAAANTPDPATLPQPAPAPTPKPVAASNADTVLGLAADLVERARGITD